MQSENIQLESKGESLKSNYDESGIEVTIDGITFSSRFDSGNIGRVEKDTAGRYCVWPAPDCFGTRYERRSCSWWHFSIHGGQPNQAIQIVIMNVGKSIAMYKRGMRPVVKITPLSTSWSRLKSPVVYKEVEGSKGKAWTVQFNFKFPGPKPKVRERPQKAILRRGKPSVVVKSSSNKRMPTAKDSESPISEASPDSNPRRKSKGGRECRNLRIFFAFCYPYPYEESLADLAKIEREYALQGNGLEEENLLDKAREFKDIYFFREHLANSIEGRRIDLLTITDFDGIHLDERESYISDSMFPNRSMPRPHVFYGKRTIFVSARVHPGETPGQFAFLGILKFLLDREDPRARCLRKIFVFKLVPMLNPDGVFHGHTRHDTLGQNLNRYYATPEPQKHPSIYAVRELVHYLHQNRSLICYFDCHAHASKRGCFIYGNQLDSIKEQIENQLLALLMSINTQHFEYDACNFSKEHMHRIDPGDDGMSAEGTGRVGFNLQLGLVHSYTLECNYSSGKKLNELAPMQNCSSPQIPLSSYPPKYSPEHWQDVGRGFLFALLDMYGTNPHSRLLNSKLRTLDRARQHVYLTIKQDPLYKDSPYPFPRRSGQNHSRMKHLAISGNGGIEATAASSEKHILSPSSEGPSPTSTRSKRPFSARTPEGQCPRRTISTKCVTKNVSKFSSKMRSKSDTDEVPSLTSLPKKIGMRERKSSGNSKVRPETKADKRILKSLPRMKRHEVAGQELSIVAAQIGRFKV